MQALHYLGKSRFTDNKENRKTEQLGTKGRKKKEHVGRLCWEDLHRYTQVDLRPRRKMLSTPASSSTQQRGANPHHYHYPLPARNPGQWWLPVPTPPNCSCEPWDLGKHLKGDHISREIGRNWEGLSILTELYWGFSVLIHALGNLTGTTALQI